VQVDVCLLGLHVACGAHPSVRGIRFSEPVLPLLSGPTGCRPALKIEDFQKRSFRRLISQLSPHNYLLTQLDIFQTTQ